MQTAQLDCTFSAHNWVYAYNIYSYPWAKPFFSFFDHLAFLCACFILHVVFVYLVHMLPVLLDMNQKNLLKLKPDHIFTICMPEEKKPMYSFKALVAFFFRITLSQVFPWIINVRKSLWFYDLKWSWWFLVLFVADFFYFPLMTYGNFYSFTFLCFLCVRRLFGAYFNIKHIIFFNIKTYTSIEIVLWFKWKTNKEEIYVVNKIPYRFQLSLLGLHWYLHVWILYVCFKRLLSLFF